MSNPLHSHSPPLDCDGPAAADGGLAALLKIRAAAQSAGLDDLEKHIRAQIRHALPVRKLAPDKSPLADERSQAEPIFASTSPDQPLPRIAQLATLPSVEGRRTERRVVNLAADLREPGAVIAEIEVADISERGFLIRAGVDLDLPVGACFWLKLPGFEPFKSQVVWIDDDRAGCRFLTPLYPAMLELILKPEPKPKRRRLFSPPPRPADVAA